jgi:hypothetical protein
MSSEAQIYVIAGPVWQPNIINCFFIVVVSIYNWSVRYDRYMRWDSHGQGRKSRWRELQEVFCCIGASGGYGGEIKGGRLSVSIVTTNTESIDRRRLKADAGNLKYVRRAFNGEKAVECDKRVAIESSRGHCTPESGISIVTQSKGSSITNRQTKWLND